MTQPQPGTQLIAGRYVVRSLIGRGGSGAVWRGEDLHLRRPVAIKQIVLSESRSTRSRTRAMREAQAVAKLQTPGVVQVYDVYDDGAQVSLIMELIEAPSLTRVVRRTGTLTPQRAAQVGQSLLATLLAVHAANVVHRDVKPSNVLVGDCGVYITDFGIALLGDDPALTAAGSVLGTPAYMAPEQARGERVGPMADFYGLGATLYFAIEGCAPFSDAGSVATTRAVRERPHRPGEHLGPLAPLIDGLLAKDPATRPAAAEVAVALDAVTEGDTFAPPSLRMAPDGTRPGDDDAGPRPDASDGDVEHPPDTPTPHKALPPVPVDEEGRQLRRALAWGAGLLVLLVVALVLLFLAVRDHPEAPATAAVLAGARPTMWWVPS
ncbi:MAG TPA: serine/threonine-protein kinase [Euzebyales bacterium]|nr:serine/threonine-protein kinase [Euzebyales bacterium]